MAKLPPEFIAAKPRLLSDLGVGESGHVWVTAMAVDPEGECSLDPGAEVYADLGPVGIEVSRREDGYHVIVQADSRWKTGEQKSLKRLPVASITVEKTKEWKFLKGATTGSDRAQRSDDVHRGTSVRLGRMPARCDSVRIAPHSLVSRTRRATFPSIPPPSPSSRRTIRL